MVVLILLGGSEVPVNATTGGRTKGLFSSRVATALLAVILEATADVAADLGGDTVAAFPFPLSIHYKLATVASGGGSFTNGNHPGLCRLN